MRTHDCNAFASRALTFGKSLPVVGKLLGLSQLEASAHYVHLAQDSVRESATRILDNIATDVFRWDRPVENIRA